MTSPTRVPALALAALLGSGCAGMVPSAERPQVQQGNVLDAADVEQVRRGQSRERVRELLGSPMLANPFHAGRWDYVYYRTEAGHEVDGTQRLSVFFDDDGRVIRVVDHYRVPADPVPHDLEEIPTVDTGTARPRPTGDNSPGIPGD